MNRIVSIIYGHGRGWAFSPNDFNGLATRDTIRKTLSRLDGAGTIRRIMHGIYDYPGKSKFAEGLLSPDPDQVALAIARKFKWHIQPCGNTALNLLGLSTQVVAHYIYSSDGPSRIFKWGNGAKVSFRHARQRDLTSLSSKTALVVLALKALGKVHVTEELIETLRKTMTVKEKTLALKEARYVTGWVYDALLAVGGKASHA